MDLYAYRRTTTRGYQPNWADFAECFLRGVTNWLHVFADGISDFSHRTTLDIFKRNFSSKQFCKLNHLRFENQFSNLKKIYLFRRQMFHLKSMNILLAVLMFSGNCFVKDYCTTKDISRCAKWVLYFYEKNLEKLIISLLSSIPL